MKRYRIRNEEEQKLEDALKPYFERDELDEDDCGGVILFARVHGKTKEMLEYLTKNTSLTGDEIMEKSYQLTLE